jgi:hypothetical protein
MRVFPGMTAAAPSCTDAARYFGGMTMSKDRAFYEQQAEQELCLAARADSSDRRRIHLDQAAAFSTMAERADDRRSMPQA